jgi:cellobiose-specific phosphotransferase system component IIA
MSIGDEQPNAAVLPLDGRLAERDPWELLAAGDGMLLSWTDGLPATGRAWGRPLRATSAMANQIREIAAGAGGPAKVLAAGRVYRLEIPTGYGAENLMAAVGGGLRTAVRAPGSNRIAGHAKLVPMASKGRRLAVAGPFLGLMALTIAAEMASGDAQDEKLTAILEGVERIDAHLAMELDAYLQTAEQAIRRAHTALLDGAAVPESIGLGTAMSHLQDVRNRSTTLLAGWEKVVEALPAGATPGAALRDALGKVGKLGWDGFPAAVRTAYLSITLDSRRVMLTAAEAQLRNPGLPLTSFLDAVETDLAARTAEIDRLRSLLVRLSTVPLTLTTWSAGVLPHLVTEGAAENARTQALFATLGSALTQTRNESLMPVEGSRIVVHAELLPDGEVQLHRLGR